jgi:hypothetical protein
MFQNLFIGFLYSVGDFLYASRPLTAEWEGK